MSNYMSSAYWLGRSDMLYYKAVDQIIRVAAMDAESLVDVGTGNSPYVEWWSWIDRKVSVDIAAPYESPNVEAVVANILDWEPEKKFDVCTCLQVLEHIDDPVPFAQRLFDLAEIVIISVPYKWPEGKLSYHPQDPVDEKKLDSWVGRKPNYRTVVAEPFGSYMHERMIAAYHPDPAYRWHPERLHTRIVREMAPPLFQDVK